MKEGTQGRHRRFALRINPRQGRHDITIGPRPSLLPLLRSLDGFLVLYIIKADAIGPPPIVVHASIWAPLPRLAIVIPFLVCSRFPVHFLLSFRWGTRSP